MHNKPSSPHDLLPLSGHKVLRSRCARQLPAHLAPILSSRTHGVTRKQPLRVKAARAWRNQSHKSTYSTT